MNPNVDRLKELKTHLEEIERIDAQALAIEPTIARPLHQAADEARRRLSQVSEPQPPSKGYVP